MMMPEIGRAARECEANRSKTEAKGSGNKSSTGLII